MELKIIFIRPEQFGFRTKEECVSLFISIREILTHIHSLIIIEQY